MAVARKKTVAEDAIADLPESGVVSVACKLPNGLILRLFEMKETEELVMGGGTRTVAKAFQRHDVEPVQLKGCASPVGSPIVTFGGYAVTRNVDAQFFAEWLRQNADSDIVKNRLVFAHEDRDAVQEKAEEQAEVVSGMQPIDPEGDYRSPRSRSGVSKVETADLAA